MKRESSFFQKKSVRALIAVGVLWFIGSFLPPSITLFLKQVFLPIVAPVQGIVAWTAFELRDTGRFLASISDLKQENERLMRSEIELEQKEARTRELEEENRLLREMLKLPVVSSLFALPAEVVSRDMNGIAMNLTLNRGQADGVTVGLPVVISGGSLIGRVSAVTLSSAEVRLLSHTESTVAARIAGTSIQGVIRGDHGLGLVFDMALSDESLESGAALVTSGLGDALPPGLLIGEIREARPSADRLFQQASVTMPVALRDIRYASILMNSAP